MSVPREVLWVLAAMLPLLLALALTLWARRRRRVASALGDPVLVRRLLGEDLAGVPWLRVALVLLAGAALGGALLDPRWGTAPERVEARGERWVLVFDVSGSMLVQDVAPNRLERARAVARELLRSARGPVGVVVFAGRAYALTPPTLDHGAVDLFLSTLDPQMVTQTGSSLAGALRQAVGLLAAGAAAARGPGAVVVLTDGDALDERAPVGEAVGLARRAGVPVHVLGVGTLEGGPVPDFDFATGRDLGFKRTPDGGVAVSRLRQDWLREIARETGGEYARLSDASGATRVAAALRPGGRVTGAGQPEAPPRYAWFAAAALLFLVAEIGWTARSREVGG